MNFHGFNIPEINNDDLIPTGVKLQQIRDAHEAEKERQETRRFIITTIIGVVAAVASVVAATASILALFI